MPVDASFHARPFTFDRVFPIGEPDVPETAVDLMLRCATLQAELEAVRSSNVAAASIARAEGFEAGLAAARADRDTALLSAVDALQASMEEIEAVQTDALAKLGREAALTAVAAADIMAARALELAPAEAIDSAIGRVLIQIARGQEVVIRVHPDLVTDVEARIALRQGSERRKLNLLVAADPSLAMGDARLVWETGGLELDADARRAAVLAELAPLIAASAIVVQPVADILQDRDMASDDALYSHPVPEDDGAESFA